ncbi:hypothetical protein OG698_12380 [Streptomyces sp. NBC_01003]|uniref:hypothetical protein n=1 Tax=Streptomyces sp. NBC_01003 TaxID=2903714 RepID=UPI003864D0FA|nr:hypothetical protein OG698_12380 [Streptomyces sp. NBC_01003]
MSLAPADEVATADRPDDGAEHRMERHGHLGDQQADPDLPGVLEDEDDEDDQLDDGDPARRSGPV